MHLRAGFGAEAETSVLQSVPSALVDWEFLLVVMIASGCVADGTVSSLLTSGFDVLGTPVVGVSCLLMVSLMVSGIFAGSFRGRPLLRFGESGGFPSSLGEVG